MLALWESARRWGLVVETETVSFGAYRTPEGLIDVFVWAADEDGKTVGVHMVITDAQAEQIAAKLTNVP